jgi:hypothetical protein
MVYIAQLLCPQGHCLLAAADDCASDADAERLKRILSERFLGLVKEGVAKPACRICGSEEASLELARTGFHTMAEALPYLKESERNQQASASLVEAWRKAQRN